MPAGRLPWTQKELNALLPKVEKEILEIEAEDESIKPLPAMTVEESRDYFCRLLDIAGERALTKSEFVLIGQLLANFKMAVQAETLGKKGRYFVISEDEINKHLAK